MMGRSSERPIVRAEWLVRSLVSSSLCLDGRSAGQRADPAGRHAKNALASYHPQVVAGPLKPSHIQIVSRSNLHLMEE
jgi:hypothetical protein